jgi:nicotinamide-nucleotide amidase
MPAALDELTHRLGDALQNRGLSLVTAESCTGGWIAKLITDIPGSSAWFERGFVTYSNAAKQELLGVPREVLDRHGAVSAETVTAMARGALARSHARVAVAVSGIAGPDGGSSDKPVGTVWLGWALTDGTLRTEHFRFSGDREAVRRQAVAAALFGLLDLLGAAD